MWGKKTVAVIIPEKLGINIGLIEDYDSTGYVDEIIVVGNKKNNLFGKKKIRTRAKYVLQKKEGLANGIKEAFLETKADIIIVTEENGSFRGDDVLKLLAYSGDFDVVFGSRTHVPLIHKGSGMTFLRRLFDDLFGKIISIVFSTSPLTDVGCILRLTNRKSWEKVKNYCSSADDFFACEWLLAVASQKIKFVEIPVNFTASKKGKSKNSLFDYSMRAVKIIFYIIKFKFNF